MLADPCGATLVPGLYGSSEGLLSRSRENVATSQFAAGYLLWCPELHSKLNVFCWNDASSATYPLNSAVTAYGINAAFSTAGGATAGVVDDPSHHLTTTEVVQDARLISACLQLTYHGAMSTAAGEIAVIENLSMESLIHGGPANQPINVDYLFNTANKIHRLGTDTEEVVFRPTLTSDETFYSDATEALSYTGAGGIAEVSAVAASKGFKLFGFAWRYCPTPPAHSYVLTKNIEWRPDPGSGLTSQSIVTTGPSKVAAAVAALDKTHGPSWTSRVVSGLNSAASGISKAAFTGTNVRSAANFGMKKWGLPWIGRQLEREFLPALEMGLPLLM